MKIQDIIKQALEKKGLKNLKEAAKELGISPELLRVTINKGHIPKDNTLILIAEKLGLDRSVLILTAHREKVPVDVKGFFLSPTSELLRQTKRKIPLSEEQCDYLGKLMNNDEIQLIRKYRQVTQEGQTQILGYIEFMFATTRKSV
ncbi:MAG TPA: helix-turn-helix transcriptional regulator [Nitrospirota bacterium]|nr:helix-turn-helix transcriptional regulator [Nitrospirota bacterium]